jgi:hypothetical protein
MQLEKVFAEDVDAIQMTHKEYLGAKIIYIATSVDTWGVWITLTLELTDGREVKVEIGSEDQEVPGRFHQVKQ